MMRTRYTLVGTELGQLTLVADGDDLVGLYFPHHWYRPEPDTLGLPVAAADDPVLAAATVQLDEYLAGARRELDVPLATNGDELQERVWALLRETPYGRTTTYGELAGRLGDRSLAQQVGQAVGRNPLCVFIPCHRVVGKDGRLTGYAGGLSRKRWLLELEEPAEVGAGRLS